jgi:hypothetical protein
MEVSEEPSASVFTVLWPEDGESRILRTVRKILSDYAVPFTNVSIFHTQKAQPSLLARHLSPQKL